MDPARALAMITAFMSMAVVFLFKTHADTLFLTLNGTAGLPALVTAQALVMVVFSAAVAWLSHRLSALHLDLGLLIALLACSAAEPLLLAQGSNGVFIATLLLLSFPAVASLALWNTAQGVVSGRAIRHFLPRLGAVATAGATLGSLGASQISSAYGIEALATAATGLTLGLIGLRLVLERHYPQATSPERTESFRRDHASRDLARDGGQLIRLLVAATLLESLIAGLVDYGFKAELGDTLESTRLAVFLSLFYAAVNATLLLVQWFGASRLFSSHPLSRNTLLTPISALVLGGAWLLLGGLWPVVAARFTDGVMRFAIARPCLEISLAPLSRMMQRRWKLLLRGAVGQGGAVLAGLLLMATATTMQDLPWLLPSSFVVLAAIWLLVQRAVARAYLELLAHAIGRKRLGAFQDTGAYRPDNAAVGQLLSLASGPDAHSDRGSETTPDPFTTGLLRELDLSASELMPHLSDAPPGLRPTLYQLIACRAASAATPPSDLLSGTGSASRAGAELARIVRREDDTDAELYPAALNALAAFGQPGEGTRAARLIGDTPIARMSAVQIAAATYLARIGPLPAHDWQPAALIRRLLAIDGTEAGLAIRGLLRHHGMKASEVDALLAGKVERHTQARLQALAVVATRSSLQALAEALIDGNSQAERAIPLLDDKALWRLTRIIESASPTAETRRRLCWYLRFHPGAEAVTQAARLLDDANPLVRRTAARTLLRKRQQQLGNAPRRLFDQALRRQLLRFEALVRARVPHPPSEASRLFDLELEQRSEQALDELAGLLALSGDPASIFSARRGLDSPDRFLQRQALDALQEVMRGEAQRHLLHLLERYLSPASGTERDRLAALADPWLARCHQATYCAHSDDLSALAPRIIALRRSTLFCDLEGERLEDLARRADWHEFDAGATIIREGASGDTLYVVVDGRVEFRTAAGHQAPAGPATVFGEMSVLDGRPRAATVSALTDSQLLSIARREFMALVTAYPEVGVGLVGVLAGWLRNESDAVAPAAGAAT